MDDSSFEDRAGGPIPLRLRLIHFACRRARCGAPGAPHRTRSTHQRASTPFSPLYSENLALPSLSR